MSQGPRSRARDSKGRPIKGVYIRDGIFSVLLTVNGKTTMKNVEADTVAEARYVREQMVSQFRGRKKKSIPMKELDQLYTDARKLSQQLSFTKNKLTSDQRKDLSRAELLTMDATDLIFNAWRKAQ